LLDELILILNKIWGVKIGVGDPEKRKR
jgi:hypothetical protein